VVSRCSVQMHDKSELDWLIESIRAIARQHNAPAVQVTFDTLNRNVGPGDDNSTAAMTRWVAADRVKDEFDTSVLMFHHTVLAGSSRSRGSNVLKCALNCELKIKPNREINGVKSVTLNGSKIDG